MNRLKERRLALGMSQPEVSAKLREVDPRMDVSMISRFECGACLPTEKVLTALETILQADRRELFGESEQFHIHGYEVAETAQASPMTAVLAELIPYGRRNAIPREALAMKLNVSDRAARQMVETARAEGLIIINECNGRGYYQSDDLDEIYHQYKQDMRRAQSVLRRCRPMRTLLRAAGRSV